MLFCQGYRWRGAFKQGVSRGFVVLIMPGLSFLQNPILSDSEVSDSRKNPSRRISEDFMFQIPSVPGGVARCSV